MAGGTPMASKPSASDRLSNVGDELKRAVGHVERELSSAAVEGFQGVEHRVRGAVASSERLARVLDGIASQGFLPRGRSDGVDLLAAPDVRSVIAGVQVALGRLAATTPDRFSEDYAEYLKQAKLLVELAASVRKRGVRAAEQEGFEAWRPFNGPAPQGRD